VATAGKRKADGENLAANTSAAATSKKTKMEIKLEMMTLMNQIGAVQGVNEYVVYDSCVVVVKKVRCIIVSSAVVLP
jgi:hypothetical protein